MGKIGIFYGSTEGNTEDVAERVQKALGDADVYNVDSATADDLAKYDILILACPTWEIGELQEDLKSIFQTLEKTVVWVTHDMGEASYFGDRIVLLKEGKIVQSGTLKELVHSPTESFVTGFINAQRSPLELTLRDSS